MTIIDISHHQDPNSINYDRLAEQISGVIIRAAYGSRSDRSVERHYAEFARRNVPVGIYHYITEYMPVQEQVNKRKSVLAGKIYPLGLWTDVELEAGATPLRKRTVDEYIRLTESQVAPIYGIYTSKHYWSLIMGGAYYTDKKLWVAAHYYQIPPLPTGWDNWWLWQYSHTGKLAGYNDNLDLNHFYGTDAQFADWIGGEVSEPEPVPPETKLFDAKVYYWATPYVNIRKEPTTYSQDLGDIYPNTIVPVYEIVGSWYKILYNNIVYGYVMSKYLQRLDYEPPVVLEYAYYGPVYNQRDIRWATHSLGTRSTIGAYGCLMTCASMVCNKFGHASNPLQLNDWLTANEGYLDGNLFLWDAIERLYPDMHFDGFVYAPSTTQIRNAILANTLPMMYVDFNDDTPLIEMHWVLGIGVTTNDVIIADPWTGTIGKLSEMYPKSVIRYGSYRKQM